MEPVKQNVRGNRVINALSKDINLRDLLERALKLEIKITLRELLGAS